MAVNQLDLIMNQVQQLSASEQVKLIKRLADLLEQGGSSIQPEPDESESQYVSTEINDTQGLEGRSGSVRAAELRDFSADRQWLADHRDEYAGQWVALKFGRLVSHGTNAKAVHRAAQDAGHLDALLVLVEPSDAPPFIL
ncbi:MAG: DUF5678 domain-containing protein [Blastocatellia bacterium]|nr:DUF5678 domain-containing protein [Blastocatellia bacterium]